MLKLEYNGYEKKGQIRRGSEIVTYIVTFMIFSL